MKEQQARRPHVYELDPLRTVTAASVVAVHAIALTVFLNHSDIGVQVQNAIVVALHFTREVFIFVTAFALVYVYYGKPFALKRFWARRSIGTLLPYCIWSVVYVWVNVPGQTPVAFIKTATVDILTGNASYQLYYILLTLQFYIILPLFLLFLKRVAHHPWKALTISFAIQVVLFYADYHLLQQGTLASSGFWQFFAQYQNRFVLVYQFYFVLGGFTALYFQQIRSYVLHYVALRATDSSVPGVDGVCYVCIATSNGVLQSCRDPLRALGCLPLGLPQESGWASTWLPDLAHVVRCVVWGLPHTCPSFDCTAEMGCTGDAGSLASCSPCLSHLVPDGGERDCNKRDFTAYSCLEPSCWT